MQARNAVAAAREDRQEQQAAATKMQAVQRGKHTRVERKEQQAAAIKLQAMQRGKHSRDELNEQQTAATKMQAAQRGNNTRVVRCPPLYFPPHDVDHCR